MMKDLKAAPANLDLREKDIKFLKIILTIKVSKLFS